tara:strand:+ start:271 stop:1098 length:828 start_codon:yes stop_codon:yes gene_type:complete
MSNEISIQNEAALEMQRTNNVADVCRDIVRKTVKNIHGKDYVQVEGWQSIATAHGCVAGSDAPVYLKDVPEKGYQARGYITHIATGKVISTAYGFVGDDEVAWANRPAYARQAMAQTRAISRACRSAFAHVVVMMDDNLQVTPAEEVPDEGFNNIKYNPSNAQQHAKDIMANVADGHWAGVVIPFGKNKGKRLGELSPNSLKWYFENYQPREYPEGSGKFSDRDIELRTALNTWGEENGLELPQEEVAETPAIVKEVAESITVESVNDTSDEVPF